MKDKISIQLVLLDTQLHISAINKISKYNSELFTIDSVESVSMLPNMDLSDWSYSKSKLASMFTPSPNMDITIGIIENSIEGNYFVRRLGDKSGILSFHHVDIILRQENIDSFNFLLIAIYKLVTLFRLGDKKNDKKSVHFLHDETRSCLFDMVGNKADLVYSASHACLCPECEAKLRKSKLPNGYVDILKKELHRVRKSSYYKIIDFVKRRPVLSLIVTAISSLLFNILSS